MPSGSVVVAATDGIATAGVFGDVMCARMQHLGFLGLITDGRVRDLAGMLRSEWPIWASGATPPPSTAGLFCADRQLPVGCGGVTVFPGDIIVADDDGVVVIPQQIAQTVASQALEMERFEEWVLRQVQAGAGLAGLYPPNERTLERYRSEAPPDLQPVPAVPNVRGNPRPFRSAALERIQPSATIAFF
jgi:regulator of RNase E activity RraA